MRPSCLFAALLLCAVSACSESSEREPVEDGRILRPRRFHPPPARVRAVPPHNVHGRGMGPYELGASLKEVLDLLPHGPRVELLAIEELFDYNLVRAEGDKLLIGAAREDGVEFVAALDPKVARTDGGVGVGASVEELDDALGTLSRSAGVVRDPRLRVYVALPNVRFVVEDGAVGAMVVGPGLGPGGRSEGEREGEEESAGPGQGEQSAPEEASAGGRDAGAPEASGSCSARDALLPHRERIALASRVDADDFHIDYGCFEFGPGALVYGADRLALVAPSGDGARDLGQGLRRVAARSIGGLLYAASIDADGDGVEEIAAVRRRQGGTSQVVRVEVYRLEGARLSEAASEDAYQLAASAAAWVGARLADVDFLVELEARPPGLHVGGFYLQRAGGTIHNLVPLEPQKLPVRRRRPASSPPDAPSQDAGAGRPPLLPPPPDARSKP